MNARLVLSCNVRIAFTLRPRLEFPLGHQAALFGGVLELLLGHAGPEFAFEGVVFEDGSILPAAA